MMEPPGFRPTKSQCKSLRVLVADDHQLVLDRVVSLLANCFSVVGTATDGEMLVEEAIRLNPDIIVSDIMMPKLNGLEAAHRIREGGSTAMFVFLTVYELAEFVDVGLAEGALGFVSKAKMGTHLVHAINEAICGRQFISWSAEGL